MQTNKEFHIHSMYTIWTYISKIDENIIYYIYLKIMNNIYNIFNDLRTTTIINDINYIKEKIAQLIDDIIILLDNDITTVLDNNITILHDKYIYFFIIGYYLYIQLINYKKNKSIYEHCLYANSGRLFDDHFNQVVLDITNIKQLQYIKFFIKIFYIALPFLPSNIYTNYTCMKFIDILIKNSDSINNDLTYQKKCNYILSILNFLQIGTL